MTGSDPEAGVPIVLTAPLTEIIDHAGYFIQMSMASLPIWLEGIINKKYPKWREVEYNDDGTARSMPAGIRVLEASLHPPLSGSRRRLLLPGRSREIHRSEDPGRGGVHPQSAGRHLRRRRLYLDFRIVEATDQFALLAPAVCANQEQPPSRSIQGDCRRIGRMADRSDQQLRRAQRRLHRRGPQRIGGDARACSRRR